MRKGKDTFRWQREIQEGGAGGKGDNEYLSRGNSRAERSHAERIELLL